MIDFIQICIALIFIPILLFCVLFTLAIFGAFGVVLIVSIPVAGLMFLA